MNVTPHLGIAGRLDAVDPAHPLIVSGLLGRAALAIGELLVAVGVVFGIPFVILAIGIPIALCVQILLWIARML